MGFLNRRQWGAAAAGLLFAAGPQAVNAQAVTAPRPATLPPKLVGTRIVIAVEPRTGLSNLPLTVAEQRNFFREEGLDVELREFADLGQAMAAVQAKAAHAMGFGEIFDQISRETVQSLRGAEAASISAMRGEATTLEVVEAIKSAEQALQTATAVRDKIVQAYQEISRMAI